MMASWLGGSIYDYNEAWRPAEGPQYKTDRAGTMERNTTEHCLRYVQREKQDGEVQHVERDLPDIELFSKRHYRI